MGCLRGLVWGVVCEGGAVGLVTASRQIFGETQSSGSKMQTHIHLKNALIRFGYLVCLPPLDSDIFWFMTVESVGVFRHFAFCSFGNRLVSFFIVPENCIFPGTSFELIKHWQLCSPKSYKVFIEPSCYTLTLLHLRTAFLRRIF